MCICVCMSLYMYIYVHIYIVFACLMKTVTLNTTFTVSLCCLQDNVSAYPGSRLVVGMIPVFNKKKAARLGDHCMAHMELHSNTLP